jgi:predicted HicB family RNase H-like nuclease
MNNTLKYKGFEAHIEYDFDNKNVSLEIPNIRTGTFRPFKTMPTIAEAEEEFHIVIDEYLERIKEFGIVFRHKEAGVVTMRVSEEVWDKIVRSDEDPNISMYGIITRVIQANKHV